MTDYQSDADGIIAVLVLYNTRLEDSITFTSLRNSLKKNNLRMDILVYDNSPTPMVNDSDSVSDNWRIHYIHNETNPGVSTAYNYGFQLAKRLQKKWVLLLDQDTTFPKDALTRYFQAVHKYKGRFLFAPILKSGNKIWSPCRYFLKRGFHLKSVNIGINSIRYTSPLNSGMLLHMSLFEKTGMFNEKLKLDFSDFYFIERYRKHFSDFVVIDLLCDHGTSTIENRNDVEKSLNRFRYFSEGAKHSANNFGELLVLTFFVGLRAAKLSLIHKNFRFFVIFHEYFFCEKSRQERKIPDNRL